MRATQLKSAVIKSALAASVLLLGTVAFAQQQVNLTAAPTSTTLPDGTTVPMWGYTCGTAVTGSSAACSALNANAAGGWSPVVITVPAGQTLQINLTNSLSFTPTGTTTPNSIPTSLVIPGQVGGGLGYPISVASPTHLPYGNTWFVAGTTAGPTFTPPQQGNRVQSFGTEVAVGASTSLTWTAPRPGTYLLESGTHPSIQVPMGLYGMVVVTQAPAATAGTETAPGCAYTACAATATGTSSPYSYDAEAYLLTSEIDPVQNSAVQAAVTSVGFSETATQVKRDSMVGVAISSGGTNYTTSDTIIFTYASPPACTVLPSASIASVDANGAITQITYNAGTCTSTPTSTVAPMVSVNRANPQTTGMTAVLTADLALAGESCSASASACYPPAINYSPLYYLVNGTAFNKTAATGSVYPASPAPMSGATNVLVRLANAGLRMHVPAFVNATTAGAANKPGITLLAEDGNPHPGTARIQSEVFLSAGKTEDVMISVPTGGAGIIPVFDRELSLSANAINRDAGMLAYVSIGGATLSSPPAGTGSAVANPDTYASVIAGRNVTVSDPSQGVLANDVNVLGAKVVVNGVAQTGPVAGVNGTLTLNANGTFTYVPTNASGDTFTYCGNGTTSGAACATITLSAATQGGAPTANGDAYTSTVQSTLTIHAPGVLENDSDPTGYPLTVASATQAAPAAPQLLDSSGNAVSGAAVTLFVDGGFTITGVSGPGQYTFTYIAQNSQGTQSNSATVAVTFPAASGLQVTVLDPVTNQQITDYRWIIEEDRTFYVDPKCTSNPLPAGCTGVTALDPTKSTPFGFGTNFHTSHMPVVATGCTGGQSCEAGQSLQGVPAVCDIGNGVCRTTAGSQTPLDPKMVNLDPTKRYYISVLPGDAANPFAAGYAGTPNCAAPGAPANCVNGHGMGGVAIPAPCSPKTVQAACASTFAPVTVLTEPSPYPTGKLSVHVFEDDFPLDGQFSPGGGVDVVAPNEPGLGGFSIVLLDAGGGPGDATGQVTYDMFNQPLSNSLAGMIDPVTGNDSCPISTTVAQDGLQGFTISAGLASGSTTFLLPQANFPTGLVVGVTLASPTTGSSAGALLPGTTVTNIAPDTTGTNYVITMSKPAQATSKSVALTVTGAQAGVIGMIVTCPKYESDGITLSPMAGMAVIANLPPARYSVVANPGADRFAAGEEWLQTNTLDGQKGHDAFVKIGEPAYFQEYGPSGFHVDIGFANPAIINARISNKQGTGMCDAATSGGGGLKCNNVVKGHITSSRLSRAPDQRIYGSRTRQSLAFTQCYVSLGDPDGFDFAFTKCKADGSFEFDNIPAGNWKITTFDQWNDQIIDGITTAVGLGCNPSAGAGLCPAGQTQSSGLSGYTCNSTTSVCTLDMGEIATHQWQANIYTRTFLDLNGNGISDKDANGNDLEPGLPLENVNNRWRDGSFSNYNATDLNGYANYNEVFPLFNWYVFDSYTTRYKTTGVHVVMDAGGPVDVPPSAAGTLCNSGAPDPVSFNSATGDRFCGVSKIAANMANTYDFNPLPPDLMLPGSVYCNPATGADCTGKSINQNFLQGAIGSQSDKPSCTAGSNGLGASCSAMSTGRIDPPYYFSSYGWQGYIGQNQWLEYGKKPFVPGETGGIRGHVIYASTRPYDDPQLLLQNQWEPLIPGVTINLYQEITAPDGTQTLKLVDHTTTSSFDDWAQGFRKDVNGNQITAADGASGVPNMNCPGQSTNDPQFFALANQPTYLDWYNNVLHGSATQATALPYNSQFKCYDGMHSWNQLQPVPYDGLYVFPSVTGIDPATGRPIGTNCTACVTDVDSSDNYRYGGSTTSSPWQNGVSAGTPVLPAGKYVVEVVLPSGYELVKEEDKNILMGDNFTAPATVQFPGLGGSIFILPDMASLASEYNATNPQNLTNNLGRTVSEVSHEGDTKQVETYWPCVGALRQVPDFMSLFPNTKQIAPFAGAMRNLCDRKEVLLTDQSSATVKFYLFTSTHVAAHFTGVILDDFTGEFDPFSPQWGEKFGPPYVPVSIKDWAGYETNRVYSDEFGLYNGLNYSTWEVNPPNPTGYSPTMMVMCMNDSGVTTKSPWWDTTAAGVTSAQPDPYYQPLYSQFCYELAFMPGQTGYFDTPVVPVASFSEGYNHADCAYPDATPAIKEVDGDGVGPWVAGLPGTVDSLTLAGGGSGYSSAPTVTLSGGGGTGAAATATLDASVSSLSLARGGNGYASAPTVTISGGGGSGAAATATLSTSVSSITVTNGGSRYTSAPTVTLSGGGGSGATARANINRRGLVTDVDVTNGGSGYTSAPTVSFSGGGGSGAAAVVGFSVKGISLTKGGSGYASVPTVSFSGGGGSGARASASISGPVAALTLTNGGSGYTSVPTVSLSGGGGSGASASATVESGGGQLTITALGDQSVSNYAYSGPNATAAPFNQRAVTRHYGFGTAPASNCAAGQACVKLVTSDGSSFPLTNVTWTDGKITGTIGATGTDVNGKAVSLPNCAQATPTNPVSGCPLQQQAYYAQLGVGAVTGSSPILSAQLMIRSANGRTSTDATTVWIGGKAPTHIAASGRIQDAIDAAAPGDLLIVDPTCNGTTAANGALPQQACSLAALTAATQTSSSVAHNEMVQMWKPVRLQGVGAASSLIDANSQPAGKLLGPWRLRINCVMGLAPDGRPRQLSDTSCSNGWQFASGGGDYPTIIADRLPLEAVLGWDANLNGNVAEQLIEPSLLGAYEGAAITVLAKGVAVPPPAALGSDALLQAFGANVGGVPAAYPDNTVVLMPSDCGSLDASGAPLYPTLYHCNPASIDGLGIHNASQGGGGIFVHAWGHNLQIANNRVYNNTGTSGGAMTLGLGEVLDPQQVGSPPNPGEFPGSCDADASGNSFIGGPTGMLLPLCYNLNLNVHHNWVSLNSSLGDELFSSTPSGAGGIAINNGDDNYKVTSNWVCGNLNVGDGAGVSHIGFSNNGQISNNTVIFNETTNPTITTNGGGVLVMGSPDVDPTSCGVSTDIDCVPPPSTITPSNGVGRNNVVNANLILGNAASSGSGGGVRLQHVNGMDAVDLPDGAYYCPNATNCAWNSVTLTNNIIANNVAGWDGAGVSMQDTLMADIVNNTIVHNDSTASSGVLLQSLYAASASAAGTNSSGNGGQGGVTGGSQNNVSCTGNASATNGQSCPQISGVAATTNSPVLMANLQAALTGAAAAHQKLTCPAGHGTATASTSCYLYSTPVLTNDLIWQNRSYYIGVGGSGSGQANKQNQVTLYNAFGSVAAQSQASTGACVSTNSYWEIGVRGDLSPSTHDSGYALSPTYSDLTDVADYASAGAHNLGVDPGLSVLYCNGSRTPPENGGLGWAVPPGTIESNGLPNPVFSLTPSAVVDEGNNWVNLRWGPLSLLNPVDGKTQLANFNPVSGSAVTSQGTNTGTALPTTSKDFNGAARPKAAAYDIGAIQAPPPPAPALTSVSPSTWARGLTTTVHFVGTSLSGGTVTVSGGAGVTSCVATTPAATSTDLYANCTVGGAQAAGAALSAAVTTGGGTSNALPVTVGAPPTATVTAISPDFGDHIGVLGPVNVTITGTNFTATGTAIGALTGITVSNLSVTSSTTITATFTIAGNATAGARTVTVTTLAGAATGSATFYVGPYLTSIAPASGVLGSTLPVTLTGYGLSNLTNMNVSGTGVTCNGVTTTAADPNTGISTLTANCAISVTAATGNRSVTASLPFDLLASNAETFAVQAPPLALLSFANPTLTTLSGNTSTKNGSVTVKNVGTQPFTLTAAPAFGTQTAGSGNGTFSVQSGGSCVSGKVINPSANCTINVRYSGQTNGSNATAPLNLTGTGAATSPASDSITAN